MTDKLTQEQEANKAIFQLNSAMSEALELYDVYGMGIYKEQVVAEMVKLALQFHARLTGFDVEISKDAELISIPLGEEPDD